MEKLAIKKIVTKFANDLRISLKDKNINLIISETLTDHLVEVGYDPLMGARPLGRKIDELIKVPLSKKILFQKLKNCHITAEWKNQEVVLTSKPKSNPTSAEVNENGVVVVKDDNASS